MGAIDAGDALDIVIVDYGMGNLRNVQKAFEHIGVLARVSSLLDDLTEADGLVLPGVGAFGDAMDNLRGGGFDEAICRLAAEGKPLLGICLGLQLLFEESTEMGVHKGLGILAGRVLRFDGKTSGSNGNAKEWLRVPHIGWNQFHITQQGAQSALLEGIPDESYAYFVHSYYVQPADETSVLAETDYGIHFASVVGVGKVFGAQPHPEKSQEVGLTLLRNFAKIVRADCDRFSGN